ncbi:HAD family hydrolase [Ferruginibacter sp. HRS2-29]|uniref:KdsC family phosphatase n=1 Tax=Ferruginibacter sp. HRS2-29 TaxID=2487334 RepID=UPI0020CF6322|nr:HAD-IIIA family hydrolase [Ferruginibacter sp. HRS2-29]MCP9750105.1 HAD-IIIA family hydrolase [Ferruginibacter sp. HRS2-29]
MNVLANFKLIKAFVLDVDGVLTDGSLILLNDGQMARTMNIKDGYALQLAVKKGYHILVISGGTSDAVKARLEKLGITNIHMTVKNKQEVLKAFVAEHQLDWSQVLYMGDDVPDVAPMKLAGLPCCPADAATEVKNISQYISYINGGKGCVREVIEKVMLLNNDWNDDTLTASL